MGRFVTQFRRVTRFESIMNMKKLVLIGLLYIGSSYSRSVSFSHSNIKNAKKKIADDLFSHLKMLKKDIISYLVKPFNPKEVGQNINVEVKPWNDTEPQISTEFGQFSVNPEFISATTEAPRLPQQIAVTEEKTLYRQDVLDKKLHFKKTRERGEFNRNNLGNGKLNVKEY